MKLSERITIQENTETRQPNGEITRQWADKFIVWSQVIPTKGEEKFIGDKKTFTQSFKFRIRYRKDVEVTDRILFEGQEFDIKSKNKIFKGSQNKFLEIEGKHYG